MTPADERRWCRAVARGVLLGVSLGVLGACGGPVDDLRPGAELEPLPPLLDARTPVVGRNPSRCEPEAAGATRETAGPGEASSGAEAGPRLAVPFPDRLAPRHAEGFTVRYDGPYKWLTVGAGSGPRRTYLLVHCRSPLAPAAPGATDLDEVTVVRVPVTRAITLSTTELSAIEMLGMAHTVVAHATLDHVSSPMVRRRIDAGELFEAGTASGLDIERILEAAPGVVFADTLGDPGLDAGGRFGALQAAGIPVVAVPSYLETTPLGRAEWLAFVALFFNREAEAEAIMDRLAARYERLAALGRGATDRPSAITGGPLGGTWHVPGGQSYMATLLADAGFDYAWRDDPFAGSLTLAFEAVWPAARSADWWIHPSAWRSRREITAADTRLASLPAFRAGRVVVHDRRTGPHGGNDYWESGNVRPDLVLADLLSLAHPDLLGDHDLVFHRHLGAADGGSDDG